MLDVRVVVDDTQGPNLLGGFGCHALTLRLKRKEQETETDKRRTTDAKNRNRLTAQRATLPTTLKMGQHIADVAKENN